MASLLFLGVGAVVAVVGSLVVWLRSRERDSSVNQSVETFRSEMGAIAPPGELRIRSRRPGSNRR